MIARADVHTVAALRREQPECTLCDGTGRHYERCDHTGYPVSCSCPECGGTRYADAPARAPITHHECEEAADVECPF